MFRPAFTLRSRAADVSARVEKAFAGLIPWTARPESGRDRPASESALRGVEEVGERLQVTKVTAFKDYSAYTIASIGLLLLFAALVMILAAGGR
jgi:hypothetical protein